MWFTRELVFLFYNHILEHIKPMKEITVTCALSLDFGEHYGNRHTSSLDCFCLTSKALTALEDLDMSMPIVSCWRYLGKY